MISGLTTWHVYDTVLLDGGNIIALVTDDQKHPLCYVHLHDVKQVKGKGTADAEKLKYLSDKHKLLLRLVQEDGELKYEANDIFEIIAFDLKNKKESYDVNHWKRILSELVWWDCFANETPNYHVNFDHIDELLRTGEFKHG